MIYLKSLQLLSTDEEEQLIKEEQKTTYNSWYPLRIFPFKEFKQVKFSDITIFYGGNGSGKSTLLNIIAEKLRANRKQSFNKGDFFDRYLLSCKYEMAIKKPLEIKIVTSDDVFDYLLDVRSINSHIGNKKNELFQEYLEYKYSTARDFMDDYEALKQILNARKKTMSSYVREKLTNNTIIEQSNGESALMFFEKEIQAEAIYILDEPENSLSAESQLKLLKFIEESARFFNCQFIISTHSPFLLSLKDSLVYDLDSIPTKVKKWTDLDNVRNYYNFFQEHKAEFEQDNIKGE